MTTLDGKEILELEKFKTEIRNFNNNIEDRNRQYFLNTIKVAFYGVAVGVGATYGIVKSVVLLG